MPKKRILRCIYGSSLSGVLLHRELHFYIQARGRNKVKVPSVNLVQCAEVHSSSPLAR